MRYLLMIYASEAEEARMSPQVMGEMLEGYGRFSEEIAAAGVLEAADRLRPTSDATTIRIRGGKVQTTDGPFAETKEQIGGYYLIDVENLDQAIEWAKKIPSVHMGSVEVRPIWEMDQA